MWTGLRKRPFALWCCAQSENAVPPPNAATHRGGKTVPPPYAGVLRGREGRGRSKGNGRGSGRGRGKSQGRGRGKRAQGLHWAPLSLCRVRNTTIALCLCLCSRRGSLTHVRGTLCWCQRRRYTLSHPTGRGEKTLFSILRVRYPRDALQCAGEINCLRRAGNQNSPPPSLLGRLAEPRTCQALGHHRGLDDALPCQPLVDWFSLGNA